MLCDATAGELMRLHTPQLVLWAERMINPIATGDFEDWETLKTTLEPLLRSQVSMYLEWAAAVTRALDAGDKQMRLQLSNSSTWEQSVGGPQKYHRKALQQLRIKFAA